MHYIVGQLNARSMPLEIALLPVVESAFEPYAYSRARAAGLWQFIPGTGSNYGLKQDWWYDGRRDVVASTRAALDYLQSLHDEFDGDWLLAIAAYNCGEGNVERAVKRNERLGKPIDFWHLKLPTETRAYVPKLLAMRRIVADPAAYGLEFSQIDDAPYFTQVGTGGQIDLQVVSEISGISKDDLYELNPAFHRWATDPTGPYSLLVPTEAAEGLEQTLLSLTPEQRMRVASYEVRKQDTIAGIAKQYATTPELLRHLNDLARQRQARRRQHADGALGDDPAAREGHARRGAVRPARAHGPRPLRASRPARRAARRHAVRHRASPRHRRAHARAPEQHGRQRPAARRPAPRGLEPRASAPAPPAARLGQRRHRPPDHLHGAPRRHALRHRAPAAGHGARSAGLERHGIGQLDPPRTKTGGLRQLTRLSLKNI